MGGLLSRMYRHDNNTTKGIVEGINNKLKLIKVSKYGFRNFKNL